ncbi:trafficking protein particle complex subunit 2-like protein [Procambarus clarkii]|uniref:trafficking protein particle complex subunit 2-like protein n=1 Tax=Procambarus clarkii TaxID=6728 RepID=UPI001E675F7D|nr:trafficking protein particle complex subunit 2-like protein [Procambarus clarkii]
MAVCVAVIGKENSPLYVWVGSGREELHLHYLAHTGLDVIQEKVAAVNKTPGDTRELYLGLLYASEEYKVFGYTTNTRIKFVIITDAANTTLRDNEIRMMFRRLHNMYTNVVCNPFYIPGEQITSREFDKGVGALVAGN